jgi:hypothetical protein
VGCLRRECLCFTSRVISLYIPLRTTQRYVALIGTAWRSLAVPLDADPATDLRDYLATARNASMKALAAETALLFYPEQIAAGNRLAASPFALTYSSGADRVECYGMAQDLCKAVLIRRR